MYIYRDTWIIHTIVWGTKYCNCNKDQYDRWNALWLWNTENHSCDNPAPSLPQTCAEVSAAPIFDYSNSKISKHPESTSVTAGVFKSTWERWCTVWEHFANLHGGLEASGITLKHWAALPECPGGFLMASGLNYIFLLWQPLLSDKHPMFMRQLPRQSQFNSFSKLRLSDPKRFSL
jgi:hypothetical protein